MTLHATLHDYWRSSASYRVRIALALKGVDFDAISVDLVARGHVSAGHLALNPQGLVPALAIDGAVLTQSLAIIEYLEETRPIPPLLPKTALARAHVRRLALAVACDIHPVSNMSVLARVDRLAGGEAKASWNRDNIAKGLADFEILLDHEGFTGAYCHLDQPSLADCALIPQLYNAIRWGVPFDHLPRLAAVHRTCAAHPAFIAAHPDNFVPS
jgi:maleylacetoacetate isomerase